MATGLCDPHSASEFIHELDNDCRDITSILHGVRLTRAASGKTRDLIAGFGEIWSTRLFARFLRSRGKRQGVQWVEAVAAAAKKGLVRRHDITSSGASRASSASEAW